MGKLCVGVDGYILATGKVLTIESDLALLLCCRKKDANVYRVVIFKTFDSGEHPDEIACSTTLSLGPRVAKPAGKTWV